MRQVRSGFTLIEVIIVISIVATVAAIALPGYMTMQRSSNERSASASLKTIVSAQADFKLNDRDGNRVADYWTRDTYAFYSLIPVPVGTFGIAADSTNVAAAIKLIDISFAMADGRTDQASYGNVYYDSMVNYGQPKAGYIYRAFGFTNPGAQVLLRDTDGAGRYYGATHNLSQFAQVAAPISLSAGRQLFIINNEATIWKYNLPASYTATYTPMAGSITNSSSTITVPGRPELTFTNAASGTFPAAPQSIGCSKLD